MPILTVGNTEIPYAIRYSERARKKRIVVTPEGVEVVGSEGRPWPASVKDGFGKFGRFGKSGAFFGGSENRWFYKQI